MIALLPLSVVALKILQASANPLAARADASTTSSTLICNQKGWDTGVESFAATDAGGYPDCYKACLAQPQCKTFAYTPAGEGTGIDKSDCQLYSTKAKDNFAGDWESPYTFYDVGCEKSSNTCGIKGYYTSQWSYVLSDTTNYPERQNVKWCYDWCVSQGGGCHSFAFDGGHCALYSVPVIGNFEKSDDGGGRAFYDLSCGAQINKTASTTTTTTTKMTTASTKSSTKAGTTTTSSIKKMTTTTTTTTTSSKKVSSTTTTSAKSTTTKH